MNSFLVERLAEARIRDMLREARQARQARQAQQDRAVKSPKKARERLSALLGALHVL